MPIMAQESKHLIIFILAWLRNILSVALIFQEVETARANM